MIKKKWGFYIDLASLVAAVHQVSPGSCEGFPEADGGVPEGCEHLEGKVLAELGLGGMDLGIGEEPLVLVPNQS